MSAARGFAVASWLLLLGVMFGGYSLLSLLQKRGLRPEQRALFRAGHAHAGVLLVMSLVAYRYLESTPLSAVAQLGASSALLAGILLQSGGFFWHAFVDKDGTAFGARMTTAGAALIAAAVLALVYGLLG